MLIVLGKCDRRLRCNRFDVLFGSCAARNTCGGNPNEREEALQGALGVTVSTNGSSSTQRCF